MTFPTEPLNLPDPVRTAMLRYQEETANHKMVVLHDDGLYRHLRFRDPQSGFYWFDVHTAPGLLTINGDMGTFVFRQDELDLFNSFFRSNGGISPRYWEEKVIAGIHSRHSGDEFKRQIVDAFLSESARLFTDTAREELWQAMEDKLFEYSEYEHIARESLSNFHHDGFIFGDTGEWDFDAYTSQYLWCLFAIVDAIRHYRSIGTEQVAA